MILDKVLYSDVTVLNLISGICIIIFGVGIAKIVSLYAKRLLKDRIKREYSEIFIKILYYASIVFIMILALPLLGFRLSGLLVAGGIVGIAIGFASQSIVSNLISGFFLLIERPVNIGNSVNIDGTIGIVEDIQIISTTLKTFDGLYIRVPNQKVFTANIINYDANVARRFEYQIGISYRDDAEKAIDIIEAVIKDEPTALKKPSPQIYVSQLGDNSVNLTIRTWAPVSEWFSLYTKLLWKIKKAIEAEGIEIPYPQRVVWSGDKADKAGN